MLVILIIEKEIKTIPMKIATISYTSMVTRFAMSTVHNGENMMIYLDDLYLVFRRCDVSRVKRRLT